MADVQLATEVHVTIHIQHVVGGGIVTADGDLALLENLHHREVALHEVGNIRGKAFLADFDGGAGAIVGDIKHLGGLDFRVDRGVGAREGHVTLDLQVVADDRFTTDGGL